MGMPWVAWIANLLDTANGRPAELIMEMGTLSLRKRGAAEGLNKLKAHSP